MCCRRGGVDPLPPERPRGPPRLPAARRTKRTTPPSRADLLAPQELRQLPPHDARVPGGHQRDGRGAVEWLTIAHGEQHAGGEPLLREVALARRILRPHLPQLELRADPRVAARHELRFFDVTCRRRDGIAVPVVLALSQRTR